MFETCCNISRPIEKRYKRCGMWHVLVKIEDYNMQCPCADCMGLQCDTCKYFNSGLTKEDICRMCKQDYQR